MTQRFEKALRRSIHDKIGCCEETLLITQVYPQEHSYLVFYYVPSLDRNDQSKSIGILLTEVLMNLE